MRSLILITLFVLFAYPFAVSPVILAIWARWRGKDAAANVITPSELPYIALIICAFNERRIIRQKIENSLALGYPREKMAIVVISDVITPSELPYIALIICAFNERRIIRQKIENSLALEYPREKMAIVVISDGSEDGTAEIVREYDRSEEHTSELQSLR